MSGSRIKYEKWVQNRVDFFAIKENNPRAK